MRGVVFLGDRTLEVRVVLNPEPASGDVVIDMKAS